ncbi:unnamed protein product [Meloidogyne enterolobii]|uniref:Uncharacterized protein n=1 Tax=Meloidogyne enterolobii TaxID=390850 RepID=A0ACB0XQM3_MELEN
MVVLSNLLHGLAQRFGLLLRRDQIVERERRAEAERERLGEAERDVNPAPASSSSEESREAATEAARSSSLTNRTETSSDVTVQTASRTDSEQEEDEDEMVHFPEYDLIVLPITTPRLATIAPSETNLLAPRIRPRRRILTEVPEAMRSQSRLSAPDSLISTRSARVRSPPPTEDEHSTAAVTRTVSALEWDDVSTAGVAPSEQNSLASSNSPALVANPAGTEVPELPANNDDIPTAIEADK